MTQPRPRALRDLEVLALDCQATGSRPESGLMLELRRLCPPEMNISLGFRTEDRFRQAGSAGVIVHSSRSPLP